MLPQAVSDIRRVLAKPECSWQEFWNVAQEYEVIKQDYLAELTTQETDLITALQKASSQPNTIGIGSIVAHADPYRIIGDYEMTATITKPKLKKAAAKAQSPYKRLHVIIPIEDLLWASQQKPSVNQLWQECWMADPYGSRWMPLTSALGYSTFISAKKILSESGLFIFKPDKSIQDGRETASWMVKNLHGSRMKEFWEKANAEKQEPNTEKREPNAGDSEKDAAPEKIRALYEASISGENHSEQGFCDPSRTTQEHLTNSSNELVRCSSDTLNEILPCEETASAPLGGASPQTVESVSEFEEELPAVAVSTRISLPFRNLINSCPWSEKISATS